MLSKEQVELLEAIKDAPKTGLELRKPGLLGTVPYAELSGLEKEGYLTRIQGGESPAQLNDRGGFSRYYYRITQKGTEYLSHLSL